MVVSCFKRVPLAAALLLAAGGCAGPTGQGPRVATALPGFSADTYSREGLISGATATEAGCRALPEGLWVRAGDRHECLTLAIGGTERPARTAVVYLPGDPGGIAYHITGGRPYVERVSDHYELSPETRHASADAMSGAMGGLPVFTIGRPGMHGSSGDHARDRHSRAEVELLDDALTQLRARYGYQDLVLFGFSSGGPVVANLLARRSDIRCAVLGSAPLDLARFYQRQDGTRSDYFAMRGGDLADPMETVQGIRSRADIFILGDQRDRSVSAAGWEAWEAAARRAGLRVHAAEIAGLERPELGGSGGESRHHTSSRGMDVAYGCATGVPAERVLRALRSGESLIKPRGQRLDGAQIRAAFADRNLFATEWYPRVIVSSRWDADGTLSYLDHRRPERRTAVLSWRVEGDKLCTTRHGCNEVLADGRFLHVFTGDPPRLRVTFVAAPPGTSVQAGAVP